MNCLGNPMRNANYSNSKNKNVSVLASHANVIYRKLMSNYSNAARNRVDGSCQ